MARVTTLLRAKASSSSTRYSISVIPIGCPSMRISRCPWSTDRRPPHRVSGISLPVAFRLASRRDAASSLSSGDTLRGEPRITCWTSASSLCASSTSFVPSSKRRRERSSIDSISTRRAGRLVVVIPWIFAPVRSYCPVWAEATLVLVFPAVRIWRVVGPLSTIRRSGSATDERMPSCAVAPPAARSSRFDSLGGRGAGPPKIASIACCCASLGLSPAVPATGGARLKSGGMINGALRATANSSGVRAVRLVVAQPLAVTAAPSTRAIKTLRMFDSLLGLTALFLILTAQKGAQQQDHDGNANRRIADIEYQKRAPFAKMQVRKVDHIAVQRPVEDVAERAAQHHAERDLVDPVLLAAQPISDADGDRAGQGDQHPAADLGGGVQQA